MNQNEAGFAAIVRREQGLRRTLGAGRLAMIAIGGAIGTGLFLGSGFAISLAGPAVLVSYAVGALVALLLMGCLAEMTIAHPTSGLLRCLRRGPHAAVAADGARRPVARAH